MNSSLQPGDAINSIQIKSKQTQCNFHQLAQFCRNLESQSIALKQLDWLLQDQDWTLTVKSNSQIATSQLEENLKQSFPECDVTDSKIENP